MRERETKNNIQESTVVGNASNIARTGYANLIKKLIL